MTPITVAAAFSATTVASGTCGDNLMWSLDSEGTISITGIGDMWNYSEEVRAPWYDYRSNITTVSIDDGITSIGNSAFGNSYVSSVVLPNSIRHIGDKAFSSCQKLIKITIPYGVVSLGHSAFNWCSSLTEIILPPSLKSIGHDAFYHCSDLTSITIPDGIVEISDYTFAYCSRLINITLPSSIVRIGNAAFIDCFDLVSANLSANVISIGDSAFSRCSKLEVNIPLKVTNIGRNAFHGCHMMAELSIPSGITEIANGAFSWCTNLSKVTIPASVKNIGSSAFYQCTSLNEVYIPSGVTSIGAEAFGICENLKAIYFGGNAVDLLPGSSAPTFPLTSTLYYPPGATGWTTPTWNGYKAEPFSSSDTGDMDTETLFREHLKYVDINTQNAGVTTELFNMAAQIANEKSSGVGAWLSAYLSVLGIKNTIKTILLRDKIGEQWCESVATDLYLQIARVSGPIDMFNGSQEKGDYDDAEFWYDFYKNGSKIYKYVINPKDIEAVKGEVASNKDMTVSKWIGDIWSGVDEGLKITEYTLISIGLYESDRTLIETLIEGIEQSSNGSNSNLLVYLKKIQTEMEDPVAYILTHYISNDKVGDIIADLMTEAATEAVPVLKAADAIFSAITFIYADVLSFPEIDARTKPIYYQDFCQDFINSLTALEHRIYEQILSGEFDSENISKYEMLYNAYITSLIEFAKSTANVADKWQRDALNRRIELISKYCSYDQFIVRCKKSAQNEATASFQYTLRDGQATIIGRTPETEGATKGGVARFSAFETEEMFVIIPDEINGFPVKEIAASAFANDAAIVAAYIPRTVETIGADAFRECSQLQLVVWNSGVSGIGESAFKGCSSLADTQLPNNLSKIEASAFANCSSLAYVNIPQSVQYIGENAFTNAPSLEMLEIDVAQDATISANAFGGNTSTNMTIAGSSDSAAQTLAENLGVSFAETEMPVIDLYVKSPPHKQCYTLGGELDMSGLTVIAKYRNGTEEDVTQKAGIVYDTSTLGSKTVSVAFSGQVTEFIINVIPSVPTVTISYTDEKVSTTKEVEYSVNNGVSWIDCTENMDTKTFGWDGSRAVNVQIRIKSTNGYPASEAQIVTIPARPAAPTGLQGMNETLTGENDGQIIGFTENSTYEISNDNGMSWQGIMLMGTTVIDLAPGSYQVRLKATENAFASVPTTVEIGTGDQRIYTLNVTAPDFEAVIYGSDRPAAMGVIISSSGNSNATISSVAISGANADSFVLNKTSGATIAAGATDNATYTIQPVANLNKGSYTAVITVTYDNNATASATITFTVNSAPQTAPAAPQIDTKTTDSVTLKAIADSPSGASVEYSKDNGMTWQASPKFAGLSSDTEYNFIARYAATTNYEASPASGVLKATTDAKSSGGGSGGGSSGGNSGGSNSSGSSTEITPDNSSNMSIQSDALPFADVPMDMWYADAVAYVYAKGMMTGTSGTTFSPDSTSTRGMIVTILYRLDGSPDVSSSTFSDVAEGQYYTDAVAWASANGIVSGYGGGLFGPHDPITREQMAVILSRYAQYRGYDITASADLSSYIDTAQISIFALAALQWANAEGLVAGTSNITLSPGGFASRAQIAAILMRFCENVAK